MLQEEKLLKEKEIEMHRKYETEKLHMEQEAEELKLRSLLKQSDARRKIYSEYETHSDATLATRERTQSHHSRMLQDQSLFSEEENRNFIEAFTALTLPPIDIPIFSGEPIEYTSFVTAFESIIESKTQISCKRLYYLAQYTKGDANKLVSSFLHDPETGYEEAKKMLQKVYGQPYCIASSNVDKLTSGGPIKSEDATALRKFSVLLLSCQNALEKIGYLNKIENPDTQRKIIARLPYDMRKRWRTKADQIWEREEREIKYKDIVDFVNKG